MRERLFRAKTASDGKGIRAGEWVLGYHIVLGDCNYIYSGKTVGTLGKNKYGVEIADFERWQVDPTTVCQSVGLTDADDKMIFENDIVRFKRAGGGVKEFIGQVVWSDRYEAFFITASEICDDAMFKFTGFTVVGNVFDNPYELYSG